MALAAGTRLGRYEIRLQLGAGGMGEVYLAEDSKLRRRIALKILPVFRKGRQRAARFLREAQAASALNHPNICTIYEINDDNDVPFISMEYVEGETLSEKIKGHRCDLAKTLEIASQIADALAEAHAHGIIHRDIKPGNIMITSRWHAKVMDFGLAKVIQQTPVESEAETEALLSTPGALIGTVPYMSPEQVYGQVVDARSDIFSFGVVLYEMLSGRQPFACESSAATASAILTREPPPLARFSRAVPTELERIISKALRKDPDERYQTAKDLLIDLRQLKKHSEFAAELERTASPETRADGETKTSIAVLPFANLSADAENEYFCDGLAEELLNALAKIENLKVAARTSAFSFKGKNANVSEIGRALSVQTVLEGSVRKSGNRLRITVQFG